MSHRIRQEAVVERGNSRRRGQRLVATLLSFGTIGLTVLAALPSHASGAGSVDNLVSAGGSVIRLPTTYVIDWLARGFLDAGDSGGLQWIEQYFGSWRSTAAITQITVFPSAGNFVTGTIAALFGVS